MDVLGLENLTTVRYALDMIKENEGIDIDLDKVDFEDQEVYEMLSNAFSKDTVQRNLYFPVVTGDKITLLCTYLPLRNEKTEAQRY